MPHSGLLPPLFERLSTQLDEAPDFDRNALAESVRLELARLLNTRRPRRAPGRPLTLLDYGIADWSALQQQRSDDRRRLARDIREAITHFEPRLILGEVQVNPVPEQPQRMSIRLIGELRSGEQHWPVAFVIEPGGQGLEVRHERLD